MTSFLSLLDGWMTFKLCVIMLIFGAMVEVIVVAIGNAVVNARLAKKDKS